MGRYTGGVLRQLLRHLAVAGLGALPLFLLLVGIRDQPAGVSEAVTNGVFYFLAYVVPVMFGAACHFIVLWAVRSMWSRRLRRAIALMTAPLLPAAVLLMGERIETVVMYPIVLLLVLVAFGIGVPLPEQAPARPTPAY